MLFGSSKILHRYIYRQLITPFVVMLIFFLSIMLSTSIWGSVTEILLRGIPWTTLSKLIGFLLLEEIPDLIPLALLFSGILVSGNLSQHLEFIAMRSCRVPISAIVNRYVIFGTLVALLSFFMNNWVAPTMSRERIRLIRWIQVFQGLSLVREGTFVSGAGSAGETIGFYTGGRAGYQLKDVFVQQVGPIVPSSSASSSAGEGAQESSYFGVNMLLFARKGVIAKLAQSQSQLVNAGAVPPEKKPFEILSRPPPEILPEADESANAKIEESANELASTPSSSSSSVRVPVPVPVRVQFQFEFEFKIRRADGFELRRKIG